MTISAMIKEVSITQTTRHKKKKHMHTITLNCARERGNAIALPPLLTSRRTPVPGSPLSIAATESRSAPNACEGGNRARKRHRSQQGKTPSVTIMFSPARDAGKEK